MKATTGTVIAVLAVLAAFQVALVTVVLWGDAVSRATMLMVSGLYLLWILGFGLVSRLGRDRVRAVISRMRMSRGLKFTLFATLLALLEEAVTTGMTNLAPLFGVSVGAAFITASTNYLDVVLGHSVVVFVPMFAAWAWMLGRRAFTPNMVLITFGLTGMLAEAMSFGIQNLASAPFWILVYGLMVYLPAYCLGPGERAEPPRARDYALALFLPILAAIPVAAVVGSLHPGPHHFGPGNGP
ncbi:MAG: hypothetical protein HRF45_00460 [Fimbriimonadia bacterium]|jgi:hypothetical protein